MAATAQIIDFQEIRRRRQPSVQTAPSAVPMMPVAWVPVWFYVPVWVNGLPA